MFPTWPPEWQLCLALLDWHGEDEGMSGEGVNGWLMAGG